MFLWRKPDGTLVELDPNRVRVIETDDGWTYEYILPKSESSVSDSMSSEKSPRLDHE
jgi:hypothetical protein